MIQVCVVCMVKRPLLSPLSAEHRTLLAIIVSPVINIADFQAFHSQWLMCDTCKQLMQKLYSFQQTALVSVWNLLRYFKTQPTVIEETKPILHIKVEPTPEVSTAVSEDKLITINAPRNVNLLTEELDVKFEPELIDFKQEPELERDCDTESSASSESSRASSDIQPATSISAPEEQVTVTEQVWVPDTQQIRIRNTQQNRLSDTQQAQTKPVIAAGEDKFEVFTHQQPAQKNIDDSDMDTTPSDDENASFMRVGQRPKKGKYIRKPPPIVTCPHCEKPFRGNCTLKVHMTRLHGEISLSECDVCGKQCRNEAALKFHKYHHSYVENKSNTMDNIRPEFFCKECCKQFPSASAYKLHMTTRKHTPKERFAFECEKCKATFLDEKRLQQHIDVKHLRQRVYKCEKCEKTYGSDKSLRRHRVTAHANRPKPPPMICHLCGKTFTIRKSLKEHLLMHEGLRPHQCPLCPATFTYVAALFTHNRLKHLKIKRKKKKEKVEKEGEEKGERCDARARGRC